MGLKVELKAGERMIIGQSVITNTGGRAHIVVEGTTPILREADILTPETASTPARRLYLCIQLMYLSPSPTQDQQNTYVGLMKEFIEAAPSARDLIGHINNAIIADNLYKALKEAKKLITYEGELLNHVGICSESLPKYVPKNG